MRELQAQAASLNATIAEGGASSKVAAAAGNALLHRLRRQRGSHAVGDGVQRLALLTRRSAPKGATQPQLLGD